MDKYGSALDFDLVSWCGMRLCEAPQRGWGLVLLYIKNLPPNSATARQMAPQLVWGASEYLLANAVDYLGAILYILQGGKGIKPKPVKRPSSKAAAASRTAPVSVSTQDLNERIKRIKRGIK